MPQLPQDRYGLSHSLFATPKRANESVVIGGLADDERRWIRIVSYRAAQLLWLTLTQLLYPDELAEATAFASTAPMRSADLPTITTHIHVADKEGDLIEFVGFAGRTPIWSADIRKEEARRLCQSLAKLFQP
ncbi:MAG: hypothetical protein D6712_21655 [Chloroflexi bacterium]|nr:MAG: hypothetical protein D6712_21655 [Chloroflexota bacterium]